MVVLATLPLWGTAYLRIEQAEAQGDLTGPRTGTSTPAVNTEPENPKPNPSNPNTQPHQQQQQQHHHQSLKTKPLRGISSGSGFGVLTVEEYVQNTNFKLGNVYPELDQGLGLRYGNSNIGFGVQGLGLRV